MRYYYLILICMILFPPNLVKADEELKLKLQQNQVIDASISSPVPGQAVQGSVVIRGTINLDGFQSYEVDFAYSADPTRTWFLIQESTIPIEDGILAVWDTSTITDGDYTLSLVVKLTSGKNNEVSISDIRVRNYSPIETDTPSPRPPNVTLVPGIPGVVASLPATPTIMVTSLSPTSTPLPTNPAEITSSQVMLTMGKGVAFTIGVFTVLGAYLGLRTVLHNRK
jgi:hypothetical protein